MTQAGKCFILETAACWLQITGLSGDLDQYSLILLWALHNAPAGTGRATNSWNLDTKFTIKK